MPEPTAVIRRYESADNKLARFIVGKACMEQLAVANRRAYGHPATVGVWLALSCVFIEYMHWWPSREYGVLGYLRPLPALASMAVPFMFLIDWLNRPIFEDYTQETLRRADVQDFTTYYSRSPSSGLWILDYGQRFVGLIALDASRDSLSDLVVAGPKNRNKKGTATTAVVRHFYVDNTYRPSGIQADLLKHAIDQAFQSDSSVQRIVATDSPLLPYVRKCLREAGFKLENQEMGAIGLFKWKLGLCSLEREEWARRRASSQ